MAPGTAKAVIEATNDALGDTIGAMLDIPEADLDNQMATMVAGDDAAYENPSEDTGPLTNATANDEAGDQALIDLVPIPSDSQSTETETYDPLDGIFG